MHQHTVCGQACITRAAIVRNKSVKIIKKHMQAVCKTAQHKSRKYYLTGKTV